MAIYFSHLNNLKIDNENEPNGCAFGVIVLLLWLLFGPSISTIFTMLTKGRKKKIIVPIFCLSLIILGILFAYIAVKSISK